MARSGKGKVVNRGVKYPKIFVYVPRLVADDTAFPFQLGEDVTVTIVEGKLVIEKVKLKQPRREPRKKRKAT